jgi:CHRD domain-containing protein
MKLRYLALAAAVGAAAVLLVTGATGAPSSSKNVLFATLLGTKEVSQQTGEKGAGDKDGRGGATAVVDGTEICVGITVKNISDPVAAHIHRGRSSVNGPIVVPLDEPSAGDPGASAVCKTIDSDLAKSIQKNPSKFYVNVHTADFPNGAARGQLSAKRK